MHRLTIPEQTLSSGMIKPKKTTKWAAMMPEDEKHTYELIRLVALPPVQKILSRLLASPARYSDLITSIGEVRKTGRTAHYLHRLRNQHCITQPKKDKLYHITWKGIKAVQLCQAFQQLSNLTIENYDPSKAAEFVNIESSRTWLESFLEKKIDHILESRLLKKRHG